MLANWENSLVQQMDLALKVQMVKSQVRERQV